MPALPTCSLHPRCPFFTLTHSSLVCSLTHHDFGSVGYSRTANFASFQLLLFTHEPRKSCSFLTGSDCFSHAREILGFPTIVAVSFSLIWDCCFPCVLWVVVFNFILCHYGFPICGLSFCILGLCIVAIVFTLKLGCCCCFPGLGCCG